MRWWGGGKGVSAGMGAGAGQVKGVGEGLSVAMVIGPEWVWEKEGGGGVRGGEV